MYGTALALRTEKSRFFRAAEPDAQNSVDNLIMTRVFQIVFRQHFVTYSGQQREDGSTMRYAKALPRDFRFLPGLHGARRTGASHPMQKHHGTRDEGNTTHALLARRVVFRCHLSSRWLCRSRSSTAISQTATTLLVLDEAKIVVAQHRSCSHKSTQSQQPRTNGSW